MGQTLWLLVSQVLFPCSAPLLLAHLTSHLIMALAGVVSVFFLCVFLCIGGVFVPRKNQIFYF